MTHYHYVRSTDGCDETFDVYRDDEFIVSIHFWDDAAQAESKAQRLVASLAQATPSLS